MKADRIQQRAGGYARKLAPHSPGVGQHKQKEKERMTNANGREDMTTGTNEITRTATALMMCVLLACNVGCSSYTYDDAIKEVEKSIAAASSARFQIKNGDDQALLQPLLLHLNRIKAGGDVNEFVLPPGGADPTNPLTALMWASFVGHDRTVALLIKEGADVNAINGKDLTAMQMAVLGGHTKIVKLLIAKGANAEREGNSLLMAVKRGDAELVRLLKAHGARE
jgi:hypothetical protein